MNQLIVQKYGGTSVNDLERIHKVAAHIHTTLSSGHSLIVVVSAMGDYTDHLLSMAHSIDPFPPKRELDMLLSCGERITTALLSMALNKKGIDSVSLTGSQCGILTDEHHGNARIIKVTGERVEVALKKGQVVIIAGFQGVSPKTKDITTLGRGGSDLTALALAHRFNAEKCEIYTDVDGVFSANPRQVPEATLIPHLSWDLMNNMAWTGANVLHNRAAHYALIHQIPVVIRSSLNLSFSGSLIKGKRKEVLETPNLENPSFDALTGQSGKELLQITLENKEATLALYSSCLMWLWSHDEVPRLWSIKKNKEGVLLEAIISTQLVNSLLSELQKKTTEKKLNILGIERTSGLAAVTLLGSGFKQVPEFVERVLSQISSYPAFIELNNNSILICVEEEKSEEMMKKLHSLLF